MARIPTLAATTAMAVALGLGVAPSPSAADCGGPGVQRGEATVDRGDTVTVNLVVDKGTITLSMVPIGHIPPI